MKKISKILITASALLLSTYGYQRAAASSNHQSLAAYFEMEVNTADNAVQAVANDSAILVVNNEDDGYFFRRFWLRLRPRVERDIPGLASFAIIPEVELLWEKQTPEGWEIYKPAKK
jgi:hypothetical protein